MRLSTKGQHYYEVTNAGEKIGNPGEIEEVATLRVSI